MAEVHHHQMGSAWSWVRDNDHPLSPSHRSLSMPCTCLHLPYLAVGLSKFKSHVCKVYKSIPSKQVLLIELKIQMSNVTVSPTIEYSSLYLFESETRPDAWKEKASPDLLNATLCHLVDLNLIVGCNSQKIVTDTLTDRQMVKMTDNTWPIAISN